MISWYFIIRVYSLDRKSCPVWVKTKPELAIKIDISRLLVHMIMMNHVLKCEDDQNISDYINDGIVKFYTTHQFCNLHVFNEFWHLISFHPTSLDTHTETHNYTYTFTHTNMQTHPQTHTVMMIHTNMLSCRYTLTHNQIDTLTCRHTHIYACRHLHTHTQNYTDTHSIMQTHSPLHTGNQ